MTERGHGRGAGEVSACDCGTDREVGEISNYRAGAGGTQAGEGGRTVIARPKLRMEREAILQDRARWINLNELARKALGQQIQRLQAAERSLRPGRSQIPAETARTSC